MALVVDMPTFVGVGTKEAVGAVAAWIVTAVAMIEARFLAKVGIANWK